MKLKIEQAIELARKDKSLEGVIIEDLKETQVRAVDALILAEYGIVIPEQNIYYSDEDIAYDPDFDDVKWSEEPLKMTWEEKMQLSEEMDKNNKKEGEISVKVNISDQEVRQWVNENHDKMGQILGNFIVDIYKANKIIKE
ncbi:MAG: hypothetical protein H6557_18650 [Lewinellaceae bacterium]|nr:hypothetical protein [Phaeodactylibacter sp.]MCB0847525.1 hypothetical protein [Bacteroidota bacterium]MCB9038636.1 hypothetical protein [Lewinellaceae bacterium]